MRPLARMSKGAPDATVRRAPSFLVDLGRQHLVGVAGTSRSSSRAVRETKRTVQSIDEEKIGFVSLVAFLVLTSSTATAVLPLRADLAELLRPVVSAFRSDGEGAVQNHSQRSDGIANKAGAAKTLAARLWPGTWTERAAQMLAADLAAARKAWIDEAKDDARERAERTKSDYLEYADAAGRVFDFHALRHQFISNLARGGASPKEAQTLARHSTIMLTMDRYTHLGIVDLSAALDRLPELPADKPPDAEASVLRATGTDDVRSQNVALPVALNVAVSPVPTGDELSRVGSEAASRGETKTAQIPEETGAIGPLCLDLSQADQTSGAGIRTPDTRIMIHRVPNVSPYAV